MIPLDPDTLEPIPDDAEQLAVEGANELVDDFGGEAAYRAGVLAAMIETGGMVEDEF